MQPLHSNAADSSIFRYLTVTHSQLHFLISLLYFFFFADFSSAAEFPGVPPWCCNKALLKKKQWKRETWHFFILGGILKNLAFPTLGKQVRRLTSQRLQMWWLQALGNMTTTQVSDTWSFRRELSLWNFT